MSLLPAKLGLNVPSGVYIVPQLTVAPKDPLKLKQSQGCYRFGLMSTLRGEALGFK